MRSFFGKLATIDEANLTSKEKDIVEYIRTHLKDIVETNMKIERLAQEVGTGYSAIYALLNKLSIQGFRDFSISLVNDLENQSIDVAENDENVASEYINLIKQNYALIEKRAIFDTLGLIRNSNRIYVCYWEGALMGPAQDLSNFFFRQKYNSYLLDSDDDSLKERIDGIREGDLFIIYSKYGTSTRLEAKIESISNKGGKIIYLSGKVPSTRVTKYLSSWHTLIVDNPDREYNSNAISKSVPFHYFNDLLIYHFLNKIGDKSN